MFDPLKEQQPHAMEKIVPIAGDVTLPNFGMSPSDQQTILENVSVVFNSAATIKFDEDLKTAMEMNVKGPRHLLELCRQMKRLEVCIICKSRLLLQFGLEILSTSLLRHSNAKL